MRVRVRARTRIESRVRVSVSVRAAVSAEAVGVALRAVLAEQHGQQVDPVEAAVRRQAHAGDRSDRRQVVERGGEHVAHLVGS